MRIVPFIGFPEDQFYKEEHPKTQLVIHYSAGVDNARGMFQGWMSDKRRVATCDGMTDDGTIYRCFDPKYWAAHVGYYIEGVGGNNRAYELCPGTENRATNYSIEVRTIGIEICNWGCLTFKNGKYYSWVGTEVPKDKVVTYEKPWRGNVHFEKFTEQEICSLDEWIRVMCTEFGILMKFNGNFDLDKDAITGVPGIYLHSNYRADKQDMHSQKELVEMLDQFVL